jgi:diadenosine tetraphosphate (Ap4A) HIT family hydrolase
MTPHIHWHVIPRFADDPHFPQSIWGTKERDAVHRYAPGMEQQIARALGTILGQANDLNRRAEAHG